ncbi:alpha-tocopherol transfer protein-like [Zophobas morio]|uniref:alpha-tocopherol transfer protein-like n=1 Tax=Zophobas morio TaxID=2755281 RepID=UPI0030827B25
MIRTRHVEDFFDVSERDVDDVKRMICEDDAKLQHLEELLRVWIESQPHFPKNYDRGMMRNFLRGAKFSLETAKRKLEGYFWAKVAYPNFYQRRVPGDVKTAQIVNVVRLPRLTEAGEKICVVGLACNDPDGAEFDMVAAIRLFWMLFDLSLTCAFPTSGEILVFDAASASARVIAQLLTPAFKNSISVLRHAYAIRITEVHVINCPSVAEKTVAAIRPLLPEKLKQRFTIHKDLGSLKEHLRPELLPSDYGGTLDSLKSYMERWTDILQENADWFEEQESVKIVGKPPNKVNCFTSDIGVDGSFRQLNID